MGALAAVKKNEFSEQSPYLSLTDVVRLTGQEGLDQQTDILDSISLSRGREKASPKAWSRHPSLCLLELYVF